MEMLNTWVNLTVQACYPALEGSVLDIQIESTKDPKHGDYACNVAMMYAKNLQTSPRVIAEVLVNALLESTHSSRHLISDITIAGPGFINFTLTQAAKTKIIETILSEKNNFGRSTIGNTEKILLEFVSSNPTGPLHVGHGRGAAFGSSLASLLRFAGFNLDCEYYINDAGRQMEILALSVWLRSLQASGLELTFPSSGYKGDYVHPIAQALNQDQEIQYPKTDITVLFANLPLDEPEGGDKDLYVDALIERAQNLLGEQVFSQIQAFVTKKILEDMRQDLSEFGVHYERWFSEKSLVDDGSLEKGIQALKNAGLTEVREGALWFLSTQFGDDKDRVLVRANGKATYFASDVAYHWNKYDRGYTKLLNVLGSDHHGYVPRLKAVVQALGHDPKALEVLLVQFAILYRGDEKVSMSTRSGSFVTLRELREEVGNDAARFFYVERKSDQHMDFDLELAKSKSNENPVYYVQYAHARIASVFKSQQPDVAFDSHILSHLILPQEAALLKLLRHFPVLIESSARACEPHQVAHYLCNLAQAFHTYYNACTFLVDDKALCQARLLLIAAVQQVLKNGLTILGVSAPEHM